MPTKTAIQIHVRLFSQLRDVMGQSALSVTLPAGATGRHLLDHLVAQYPALQRFQPVIRLAVNHAYVVNDTALEDGDEVALITPVSGG